MRLTARQQESRENRAWHRDRIHDAFRCASVGLLLFSVVVAVAQNGVGYLLP
jgi:hypothetical protein